MCLDWVWACENLPYWMIIWDGKSTDVYEDDSVVDSIMWKPICTHTLVEFTEYTDQEQGGRRFIAFYLADAFFLLVNDTPEDPQGSRDYVSPLFSFPSFLHLCSSTLMLISLMLLIFLSSLVSLRSILPGLTASVQERRIVVVQRSPIGIAAVRSSPLVLEFVHRYRTRSFELARYS